MTPVDPTHDLVVWTTYRYVRSLVADGVYGLTREVDSQIEHDLPETRRILMCSSYDTLTREMPTLGIWFWRPVPTYNSLGVARRASNVRYETTTREGD